MLLVSLLLTVSNCLAFQILMPFCIVQTSSAGPVFECEISWDPYAKDHDKDVVNLAEADQLIKGVYSQNSTYDCTISTYVIGEGSIYGYLQKT